MIRKKRVEAEKDKEKTQQKVVSPLTYQQLYKETFLEKKIANETRISRQIK
jgi:hypothetical protein